MMLNCVVVDDESLACDVLDSYLRRLDFVQSIRLFGSASEALVYLENHSADVLFLDIEMPGLNGIEFLKALTHPPITVFTTAYRNYAFEGFELGVIDFLLKPIAYPRFLQAVEKIRDFLALKEQNSRFDEGRVRSDRVRSDPAETPPEWIFVKSGVQRIKLNFEDVTYIQGLKDYAIIYTNLGKIVIKGSIKAMLDIFPPGRFLRVHKSFIVALSRITRIERNRLLLGSNQIPIGRNYKEEVEKALVNRRQ
ncbi:LytTR family DNA-binding domain-containing protein [Nibrella viscosa]|uniref:LytTR family DNA-binding domain-containing protein n=1 Tax=Nibrella viscosa TaxID=1084524 RepID=A0ABP8JTQ3_9BACT